MSNDPLMQPAQVSANGQEVWDWAGRFSDFVHLTDAARKLAAQIRTIPTECGACRLWMTKQCPRERPGTGPRSGYSTGPNWGEPICSQFELKDSSAKVIEMRKAELGEVEKKLAALGAKP